MDIVVTVKMVPDLVEELEVNAGGTDLDRSVVTLRINEFDEHALEQALLLKDQHGARVTVVALDSGEVDETLFTCLAKGADRAVKVTGDFQDGVSTHGAAAVLTQVLGGIPHELILTGVQAADDRDGQLAGRLGSALPPPHLSVRAGGAP